MRRLLLLVVGTVALRASAAPCHPLPVNHDGLTHVLATAVRGDAVDYRAVPKPELVRYLSGLQSTCAAQFKAAASDERKAFLINAYNAQVILFIVDAPGTKSVMDLAGGKGAVFKKPVVKLGTVLGAKSPMVSLDELETAARAEKDPRVHFALVCAAKSCPQLRPEAYEAGKLNAQLEDQTKKFLGDDARGVALSEGGRVARLSMLFDWYKDDFNADGGVLPFIAKYRPVLREDGGSPKIEFLTYDWALNGTPR